MMYNTIEDMYNYLVDVVGVQEQTMQVATALNGYNTQTMCDVLYVLTGYRDFTQYDEEVTQQY